MPLAWLSCPMMFHAIQDETFQNSTLTTAQSELPATQ
jgi:hypothetical protein